MCRALRVLQSHSLLGWDAVGALKLLDIDAAIAGFMALPSQVPEISSMEGGMAVNHGETEFGVTLSVVECRLKCS